MFFGEWKTTVNAPRETVWQFVKDAENIDAWFPRRQSFSRPKYDGGFFLKQIDIQPDVAQGTFTVTNVVPGEEVSLKRGGVGIGPEQTLVLKLIDAGQRCEVRLRSHARFHPWTWIWVPLMVPLNILDAMVENHIWPFTRFSPLRKLRNEVYARN